MTETAVPPTFCVDRIRDRLPRLAIFAATALTSLLFGAWGIRREDSIWRDESITYQVAHRSVEDILRLTSQNTDAVHGLYYLLMHFVFGLLGDGLVALRLPSVLATALATIAVTAIAMRVSTQRVALFSGMVFAGLPMVQIYQQEGRAYALVTALVATASYLMLQGLSAPRWRTWALYGGFMTLASWFHELALAALLAHGVTVLLSRSAAALRAWGTASGCAIAVASPLIVTSIRQSGQQLGWLEPPPVSEYLQFGIVILLGGIFVSVLAISGQHSQTIAFALPLLLLPKSALFAVSVMQPMWFDRYVLYSTIGFAILAGAFLGWIARAMPFHGWTRPAMVTGVLLVAYFLALTPIYQALRTPDSRLEDVRMISSTVRQYASPGGGSLFMPARIRSWAILTPGDFSNLTDIALEQSPVDSGTLQGTEVAADTLRHRLMETRRIVALVDSAAGDGPPLDQSEPERTKRDVLRRYFHECERTELGGVNVVVYSRSAEC